MMIRNVFRLALRRLRYGWKIHLAALLLTAITGSAFLLYQSYMQQIGTRLGQQTSELTMVSDIYVDLPVGQQMAAPAVITGSWRTRPTPTVVAEGNTFTAGSSFGRLPVVAIKPLEGYNGPLPSAGQALVPESMAESFGLPLGGQISLLLPGGKTVQVMLSGTYASSPATATLLVASDWYSEATGHTAFNRFFYKMNPSITLPAALSFLSRFYPEASLLDRYRPADLARQAVSDTYSSGSGLVTLVFLFLGLGVLTALLLSFLDSKRELSVLKSLGLTPRELWGLFIGSGVITALLGTGAAVGLALGTVSLLRARGVQLPLTSHDLPTMLTWITVAYVVAVGVPAGLARRATVNQLLYDQPIPMLSTQVTSLKASHPIYVDRIADGWQIVRLPVVDGVLDGFVFKHVGDIVKKGEVLAYVPGWWGMTYTEYVAKIDGTIGLWMEEAGFLGVKPDHEAAFEDAD